MPHASHRLDLIYVPADPDRPSPQAQTWPRLRDAWTARGWIVDCRPGPHADALIPGGFERVWISYPRGGRALYANQQGGYRALCPTSGAVISGGFASALQAWVEGSGPRALPCPSCGVEHPLEAITLRPPGAFGTFAIILSEVAALELTEAARADLEDHFGPLRSVLRRVG